MKNILLLIHDDAGQEARLQAALDVTRAMNGHLTCLDVAAFMPFVGDSTGVSGGAMLLELERESEAANRSRIEPRVAAEGVAWSWIDTTDYVAPALERAAALADLIVVSTAFDALPLPDLRGAAASLVAAGGRPVLAVPQEAKGLALGAAMIAWNGSTEAADALAAAVPLLRLTGRVTIVEVDDGSIGTPAEEAAAYLSRHGIEPRVDRSVGSAADSLLARAASGAFDYIVMGGFGRSRIVEALFGGVTRRLLADSPIPLLITH